MLRRVSPADILMRLIRITKIKINNDWTISEINSKTINILKTIDVHIT